MRRKTYSANPLAGSLAESIRLEHPIYNDTNDPDYELRIEDAIAEYIDAKYGDPDRWGGRPFFVPGEPVEIAVPGTPADLVGQIADSSNVE